MTQNSDSHLINELRRTVITLETPSFMEKYLFPTMKNDRCKELCSCYSSLAMLYKQSGNKFDAIKYYEKVLEYSEYSSTHNNEIVLNNIHGEIAKLSIDIDFDKSIKYYNMCIDFYKKHKKTLQYVLGCEIVGNAYKNKGQIEKAIEMYKCIFDTDDSDSLIYKKCLETISELIVLNPDYDRDNYELLLGYYKKYIQKIENEYCEKYMGPKYIIKCVLIEIILNHNINEIQTKYANMNIFYNSSAEKKLTNACIHAIENNNAEELENACFEYDNIYKMDKILVALMLRIKSNLSQPPLDELCE